MHSAKQGFHNRTLGVLGQSVLISQLVAYKIFLTGLFVSSTPCPILHTVLTLSLKGSSNGVAYGLKSFTSPPGTLGLTSNSWHPRISLTSPVLSTVPPPGKEFALPQAWMLPLHQLGGGGTPSLLPFLIFLHRSLSHLTCSISLVTCLFLYHPLDCKFPQGRNWHRGMHIRCAH